MTVKHPKSSTRVNHAAKMQYKRHCEQKFIPSWRDNYQWLLFDKEKTKSSALVPENYITDGKFDVPVHIYRLE